jgi:[glutamine synthetase] adenylyltransferase / [glutamine synthetase]-adenylyl-L-tyrosine phosphorylase
LGEGSIRDIEFVVQYLQLAHGARQPEIRSRNTLEAIRRLTRYGLLSLEASRELANGYGFLRTIEHHLQIMFYRQTYTLPNDPAALAHLALRLGFQGDRSGAQFLERYKQHSVSIRSIFLWYLGGAAMDKSEKSAGNTPEVRRHIERMDPSYEAAFTPQDITRHAALADQLDAGHLVQVGSVPLEDNHWRVTIVGFDYPGELSLICGLMFVYGLNIFDGNVFTYEPVSTPQNPTDSAAGRSNRRKIVDVFTVAPENEDLDASFWARYASDLSDLLSMMQSGQRQEAQVQLVKRAAEILRNTQGSSTPLYPIEIEINNDLSKQYSVLRISGQESAGFLYELTNALAFSRIYIARVEIETLGSHIRDTLYVTDSDGHKIISPNKQRELRAATVLTKHFTHLLPLSSDPESALLHFHAFIGQLLRRADWPDEFVSLERPEVLSALAQLLGVSDFLWDDFLRMQHANLFPVVRDVDALETAKSRAFLQAELEAALLPVHNGPQPPAEDAPWRGTLNAFKDREMFRIDMRHILGHTQEFWEFSEELTDLAEVIVNSVYHLCAEDLRSVYGNPMREDGSIAQMSICALGKCGGRELGFASDIELMFVYTGNGKTAGPNVITTSEFFEKVVENFVSAIQARREGIFQIDLQLRPYGKGGSLAVPLEAFRKYFSPEGPAWPYERQALVRLRPIAGDEVLGQRVVAMRDAFVYTGIPFDVTAMHAMRERQIRHLVKGGTFNPKFSPGGLVDIEYLVQGLQITYGAGLPELRTTNTREALSALYQAGILNAEDYTYLHKAHTFLRWLIDSLRMVAGNAKDLVIPPENSEEFAYLSRRLRYGSDRGRLKEDLLRFTAYVQEVNQRLYKA